MNMKWAVALIISMLSVRNQWDISKAESVAGNKFATLDIFSRTVF